MRCSTSFAHARRHLAISSSLSSSASGGFCDNISMNCGPLSALCGACGAVNGLEGGPVSFIGCFSPLDGEGGTGGEGCSGAD